jgi:hypothetical protein
MTTQSECIKIVAKVHMTVTESSQQFLPFCNPNDIGHEGELQNILASSRALRSLSCLFAPGDSISRTRLPKHRKGLERTIYASAGLEQEITMYLYSLEEALRVHANARLW